MKKLFALFAAFCLACSIHAAAASAALSPAIAPPAEQPVLSAGNILLPIGNAGKTISLMNLAVISVQDFQVLSGRKLNFFERIGFTLGQRKLRRAIRPDGTLSGQVAQEQARMLAEGKSDFHAGGFFLGFLLNIYAIPIVCLMKDANRKRRIKWMWIGLGSVFVLAAVIAIFIALAGFR